MLQAINLFTFKSKLKCILFSFYVQDEEEFDVPLTPGSARDGLPIVYTMLPTSYSSGASTAAETPSKPRAKSPRPTRGKNPFFNVNKRKHFEFYQYF